MTRALVMIELVLSSALLIAAGLMMRSLAVAAKVDPGFGARDVSVINIRRQPDARSAFVVRAEIAERLRAVPGVTDVGMATRLPVAQPQSTRSFFAADAAYDPDARPIPVVFNAVDRGFFDTLNIHLPPSVVWPERPTTELEEWPAIATTTAVSRLWPSADSPRTVSSGPTQYRLEAAVPDMRTRSLTGAPAPAMFVPIGLTGDMPSYVLVRSERTVGDHGDALRRALAPLSSDIIVRSTGPYAPMLVASMSDTVIAARLGVPLSTVAMLLAAIGLYSAAARRVVERRRDFGVRLAMGANPHAIVRAELFASLRMSVPAVVGGALLIGLAQPVLARAIFGVSWRDTLVIPVVAVLVVTLALVAAYVPARRASRINPLQAFRE